jgi:transposase
MAAICKEQYSLNRAALYLAFELSSSTWKLGFTIGHGQRPRERNISARDLKALEWEIDQAKKRFGLPQDAPVLSCYEAGRDGFWLHRYLESVGVLNLVVDSSSIEVNRRKRRAKTDSLDVAKLLTMLLRYHGREKKVWHVVRVPTVEQEDNRQLHREMMVLKKERTRHINRIKALLTGQGLRMQVRADFLHQLETIRLWDGSRLPEGLVGLLQREHKRLQLVEEQIGELERERKEAIRNSTRPDIEMVRHLLRLRAIGVNSAWLFTMEFFGWRKFRNQKEVGALSGLTPTPSQSGSTNREQGIGKSGNRYVRALAIEIAWGWLRYQPDSELTRWYEERFAHGSSRMRRIGIVAVARKLLVELWRYLETGAIPEGAVLKPSLV